MRDESRSKAPLMSADGRPLKKCGQPSNVGVNNYIGCDGKSHRTEVQRTGPCPTYVAAVRLGEVLDASLGKALPEPKWRFFFDPSVEDVQEFLDAAARRGWDLHLLTMNGDGTCAAVLRKEEAPPEIGTPLPPVKYDMKRDDLF